MNREALIELRAKVEAGEWDDWCEMVMEPHPYWSRNAFNGSIDAAKALHEAVLPEWAVDSFMIWPGSYSRIEIIGTHEMNGGRWHANADGAAEGRDLIPARAWLLAILSALIAKEKGGE